MTQIFSKRAVLAAIIAALTLAVVSPAAAQQRVLFRGTVLGWDSAPMRGAHVSLWRHQWGSHFAGEVDIDVSSSGKFITKLYPGLYTIRFSGVDHAQSEPRYLFIDAASDGRVEARLQRSFFTPLENLDTLFVGYVPPSGYGDRITVPMEPLGEGRFRARFPYLRWEGGSDPALGDPIPLHYHIVGLVPDRWVNGTEQDRFVYDGGGDFFSVLDRRDSVMTVHFDYHALAGIGSAEAERGSFQVSGAPLEHPYAVLARRWKAYGDLAGGCGLPAADSGSALWQSYIDQGMQPIDTRDTAALAASRRRLQGLQADSASAYLAELRALGEDADPHVRDGLLLLYLRAARVPSPISGSSGLHESEDDVRAIVLRAAETIPPASPLWNEWRECFSRFRIVSDSLHRAYVERVLRENPHPAARYAAYDHLKGYLRYDSTSAGRERASALVAEARELLAGTPYEEAMRLEAADPAAAARLEREVMRQQDWMHRPRYEALDADTSLVGRVFPPFRFHRFRDTSAVVTGQSLRGAPCVLVLSWTDDATMASLEALQCTYGDRGLRILLVAGVVFHSGEGGDRVSRISSRASSNFFDTSGWTLVQAEREALEQLLGTLGEFRVGSYLLDADGVIRAAGPHMQGIFMEYSVEELFGKK